MLISENLKLNNTIKCSRRNILNDDIEIWKQPNTVVNTGKHMILDSVAQISGDYKIKYAAVGIASGATSGGSIKLQSEIGRNPVIYLRGGEIGTFSAFFDTSEVSGSISEIGFFGGTSAFTSTNTGTLFNRIVLTSNLIKNQNYTLTIDLDIGF